MYGLRLTNDDCRGEFSPTPRVDSPLILGRVLGKDLQEEMTNFLGCDVFGGEICANEGSAKGSDSDGYGNQRSVLSNHLQRDQSTRS